jgi:hypothetical protein
MADYLANFSNSFFLPGQVDYLKQELNEKSSLYEEMLQQHSSDLDEKLLEISERDEMGRSEAKDKEHLALEVDLLSKRLAENQEMKKTMSMEVEELKRKLKEFEEKAKGKEWGSWNHEDVEIEDMQV